MAGEEIQFRAFYHLIHVWIYSTSQKTLHDTGADPLLGQFYSISVHEAVSVFPSGKGIIKMHNLMNSLFFFFIFYFFSILFQAVSCKKQDGGQVDISACLKLAGPMPPLTQACQLPCQDDCQLTTWSKFSSCAADCVGVRTRRRALVGEYGRVCKLLIMW